jgi:hypothetical protein
MTAEPKRNDLELLSVVIPARDEEAVSPQLLNIYTLSYAFMTCRTRS